MAGVGLQRHNKRKKVYLGRCFISKEIRLVFSLIRHDDSIYTSLRVLFTSNSNLMRTCRMVQLEKSCGCTKTFIKFCGIWKLVTL